MLFYRLLLASKRQMVAVIMIIKAIGDFYRDSSLDYKPVKFLNAGLTLGK